MNSLVVLLSVMALVAAKPSPPEARALLYAAPIGAAPNVSPVVAAPLAYTAPIGIAPLALAAPAAVSFQSQQEIKSAPGVINTVAAAPLVNAFGAPIAYTAPFTAAYSAFYNPAIVPALENLKAAAADPVAVAAPAAASEVSAEANLPVAPTETPEVAAARAAHLEAKAREEESHQIQKRSVYGPAPVLTYSAIPHIPTYTAPNVYSSPVAGHVAYSTPVLTGAYGLHPY